MKLETKLKKGIYRHCENCRKEFYLPPSRKTRKYCTVNCFNESLKTNTPIKCLICDEEFYCSKSQQKYRNRKTCSRKCMGIHIQIRGLIRRATGGKTEGQKNRSIRYSKPIKEWRKAVFQRDDYTCQLCNKRGGVLNADHIKPFAEYPELRLELSNGRTLCIECHKKTPTWGVKKKK